MGRGAAYSHFALRPPRYVPHALLCMCPLQERPRHKPLQGQGQGSRQAVHVPPAGTAEAHCDADAGRTAYGGGARGGADAKSKASAVACLADHRRRWQGLRSTELSCWTHASPRGAPSLSPSRAHLAKRGTLALTRPPLSAGGGRARARVTSRSPRARAGQPC